MSSLNYFCEHTLLMQDLDIRQMSGKLKPSRIQPPPPPPPPTPPQTHLLAVALPVGAVQVLTGSFILRHHSSGAT